MSNPETILRADHETAVTAARNEGVTQGRAAAVERVRGILTSAEAKGREPQALVFALDSDMSVEVAIKALAASPVAASSAPKTPALADRQIAPVPNAPGSEQQDTRGMWNRSLKRAGANVAN